MNKHEFLTCAGLLLIFAASGTENMALIAALGAAGVALMAISHWSANNDDF